MLTLKALTPLRRVPGDGVEVLQDVVVGRVVVKIASSTAAVRVCQSLLAHHIHDHLAAPKRKRPDQDPQFTRHNVIDGGLHPGALVGHSLGWAEGQWPASSTGGRFRASRDRFDITQTLFNPKSTCLRTKSAAFFRRGRNSREYGPAVS